MRKVLVSLVIASASLIAVPVAAQGYYGGQPYPGGYAQQGRFHGGGRVHRQLQRDIDQIENRIHRSAQRGRLSRREAISLSRQANRLRRDYYRFARNGLDRGEVRNLAVRLERLHVRLREERNHDDRYRRRGW